MQSLKVMHMIPLYVTNLLVLIIVFMCRICCNNPPIIVILLLIIKTEGKFFEKDGGFIVTFGTNRALKYLYVLLLFLKFLNTLVNQFTSSFLNSLTIFMTQVFQCNKF